MDLKGNNLYYFIIIGIALFVYTWYYILIVRRNRVLNALSGINVQLKKRHDLIPNLISIAQKFMQHEKSLLSEITELRAKASQKYNPKDNVSVKEHFDIENILQDKLTHLSLNVENYPELKSDENMLHAQRSLHEIEEHIAASRRFYNSAVMELNNAAQIFPGNLIAKLSGIQEMPYFESQESDKIVTDIDKLWK